MSAYSVTVRGETFTVLLKGRSGNALTFSINDREYTVPVDTTRGWKMSEISITPMPKDTAQRVFSGSKAVLPSEIKAPLPGIISDIKVSDGDTVPAGGTLVVIEAMKMENPIKAPAALRVSKVLIKKGQEIPNGAPLLSIEPA